MTLKYHHWFWLLQPGRICLSLSLLPLVLSNFFFFFFTSEWEAEKPHFNFAVVIVRVFRFSSYRTGDQIRKIEKYVSESEHETAGRCSHRRGTRVGCYLHFRGNRTRYHRLLRIHLESAGHPDGYQERQHAMDTQQCGPRQYGCEYYCHIALSNLICR